MTKHSKAEIEEQKDKLRKWLKPGDTVHTVLDHVSRSGMSRDIRLVIIGKDGTTLHPNYAAQVILGYPHAKRGDGLRVGGCGMDMGFHLIHSLGYALYGEEARSGTGAKANALRRALLKADRHYYTQLGTPAPDPNKPGDVWFGCAGYALKHRWL